MTPPRPSTTRRYTVLVADDHAIVKEGLVDLLKEHDFDVVGAVGDGHQLIDAARRLRPDLIVTDLTMPGLTGLDALTRLKAERIDSKVIVLTMHSDAELATRAMRAGASGFLLKDSAGEELLNAINQVMKGRVYLAPAMTREVIERMAVPADQGEPQLTRTPTPGAAPALERSAHERNCRGARPVGANRRNPQVSDHADPRRRVDRRTGQVRDRTPPGRRLVCD